MSVPQSPRSRARGSLSCEQADKRAIRYFFNGLPKKQSEGIRIHLAGCSRCRRKLEVFASVWGHARETNAINQRSLSSLHFAPPLPQPFYLRDESGREDRFLPPA